MICSLINKLAILLKTSSNNLSSTLHYTLYIIRFILLDHFLESFTNPGLITLTIQGHIEVTCNAHL